MKYEITGPFCADWRPFSFYEVVSISGNSVIDGVYEGNVNATELAGVYRVVVGGAYQKIHPADIVGVSFQYFSWPAAPFWNNASKQNGDIYELGFGYAYDSTTGDWYPVRGFGLLLPGGVTQQVSLRLTNDGTKIYTNVSLFWSSNTNVVFDMQDENSSTVIPGSEGFAFLSNANGFTGKLLPGESCIVHFRGFVISDANEQDNPIILEVSIRYSEV